MKLLEVHVPQYTIAHEPDAELVGGIVDTSLKQCFGGKTIVLRGVASSEHPTLSVDALIDVIRATGTDRYDESRKGDRYENIEGKQIDLFGLQTAVSAESEMFKDIVWGFYHSAKEIHGYPMKIDVVIVYDAEQMNQVLHRYAGRDEVKDDGFTFKDPNNKATAVIGIIKIS